MHRSKSAVTGSSHLHVRFIRTMGIYLPKPSHDQTANKKAVEVEEAGSAATVIQPDRTAAERQP
jgi:hypothetical protein